MVIIVSTDSIIHLSHWVGALLWYVIGIFLFYTSGTELKYDRQAFYVFVIVGSICIFVGTLLLLMITGQLVIQ